MTSSAPRLVIVAPVKFTVPPGHLHCAGALKVPPDSVNVPPPKSSVAPLATVNAPAVDVPPPLELQRPRLHRRPRRCW